MLNVKNGWIKAVWGPLRRFAGEWAGDNASLMAAGVAFGLTYWALAGRNAGRWRDKRRPAA